MSAEPADELAQWLVTRSGEEPDSVTRTVSLTEHFAYPPTRVLRR